MLLEQHQHWQTGRKVLASAWQLVRKHHVAIAWLWLGQIALTILLTIGARLLPGGSALTSYLLGLFSAIVFLYQVVMIAALIRLASDRNPRSLSKILTETVVKKLPALVALAILIFVATLVASFFFVLPGIVLLIFWSMAMFVLVVEDTSVRFALQRSVSLVRGWWWPMLHRALFFLSILIVQTLIGAVPVVGVVISVILTLVILPASIFYFTLTYTELVDLKKFKQNQVAQMSLAVKFLLACWAIFLLAAYAAAVSADEFVRKSVLRQSNTTFDDRL